MMILQLIGNNEKIIHEIADSLLKEKLLANAMITGDVHFKEKDANGAIISSTQYTLKGISKALLFNTINKKLREKYKDEMPLLYSEPIILIDPHQIEDILNQLQAI